MQAIYGTTFFLLLNAAHTVNPLEAGIAIRLAITRVVPLLGNSKLFLTNISFGQIVIGCSLLIQSMINYKQ